MCGLYAQQPHSSISNTDSALHRSEQYLYYYSVSEIPENRAVCAQFPLINETHQRYEALTSARCSYHHRYHATHRQEAPTEHDSCGWLRACILIQCGSKTRVMSCLNTSTVFDWLTSMRCSYYDRFYATHL